MNTTPRERRALESGITLIELMVAITVGLILLAGIIQLFVSNKQAFRLQEGTNILNENARYALNQVTYSIRMAGHYGGARPDEFDVFGTAPAPDCTESPALSDPDKPANAARGLDGFDGDASSPLDCIPDADYHAGTDILIVRYAGPNRVADDAVDDQPNAQFVRVLVDGAAELFDGADFTSRYGAGGSVTDAAFTVADADDPSRYLHANYVANVVAFFIRNCASQDRGVANQCDAADDSIPTLARLVLRNGQWVQEDIIAGVEQLQVTYGVDDNGTGSKTESEDSDFSPDRYLDATAVTAEDLWDKVTDVRLSLVLRNTERDMTYTDTQTYRLYGGVAGAGIAYTAPADALNFRRKLFNTSVQVRNLTRAR